MGVKLPKELTKAIEVYEAIRWTEVGHTPVFDLAAVTPDNAEAKIREFADQLALSVPVTEHNGVSVSVMEAAKRWAVNDAATAVYRLAGSAVPSVIEQLTPEFAKHARAYVEAVAMLPDEITAETLVSAGADAVQAYAVAQSEAAYLNKVSSWVAGTRELPGHTSDPNPTLRILRPVSAFQLIKLDEAHHEQSNTLRAIDPVFVVAARLGVEFGINTLREAGEIRSALAIRPQKLQPTA
ncbi:hypothetical protein [Mycobacterium persicum]|uniref:hypothetical protein n=1 Tax=Mycobacterium persicum TaxID=1487726 RepID=UPI0020D16F02|nr:hypothetical protein [Mycobacterium persicum]